MLSIFPKINPAEEKPINPNVNMVITPTIDCDIRVIAILPKCLLRVAQYCIAEYVDGVYVRGNGGLFSGGDERGGAVDGFGAGGGAALPSGRHGATEDGDRAVAATTLPATMV
jgi:hypothetical protein